MGNIKPLLFFIILVKIDCHESTAIMAEPIPSNGGWQNCNWRKPDNAKTKNYGDSRGQVHDGLFKFLFGASQVGVEGFEHK